MGTSESRMEPIVSENILEEESSTGDVNYTKQQGYADVSRINKGVISDHDDPATPLECETCGGSEKDSTSTDTVKENESDGIVESTNLSLQDTSDSLKNCKTIVETNEMKGVMVDGLENSLGSPSPVSSATGDSPIPCSPSKIEQVEESMMRAMILKYFTEPLSSSDNSLPAYYVSEEKYGKLWLECPEASDMDSCEHKRSCSKFSQLRASNFIQLGESLIGYPASSWFEKNTLGSPVHSEKSIDPENNETKPMRVQIWITEKSHPTAYDVKNDTFLKMCVVEEINRSDLVPPHRAYLTTDGNIEFSLNVGNQKEGIADFIDEFQRTQNFGLDRKQYSPSWESVIDALNRIPLYVTSEQAMSHSKSKTRSRGKRGRKHKKSASKEGSNNEKTDFNDESIVTNLQSEFTFENDTLGVPVSTGVGIDCLNHGGSIVELVRSVDFYKAFSELSNNDEPSKMNDLGNDGVGSTKTVVSVDASFAVVGSGVNDELVDSSNFIQDESNNGMDEMSDIGLDGACHALDQIHLTESPEELMMRNGIQDFIDEQNTETMNHTTDEGEKSLQNRASSASPVGFTETCVDQEPMSEVDWMGVTIGIEKILADETGGSETDDSEKGSNIELSDKKGDSDELVNHIKEDLLDDESEDMKHSDNHSSESDDETSGSSTETESQDSESLTTDVTSPRALSEITDKESTSNMGISSKANEDVMRFEKIELSSSLNSLRDIGLKVVHPRGINIVSYLYKIPDAHWLAGTGIEPVSTPIKLIKSSSQNVSSSLLKALERTCFKVDNATSSTPGKVASTSSYEPKPNTINTIKSPSQVEPSTTLKVLEKTCSKVGNATNSTSEKVASTSSCEPKSTTIMIKSSSQDVSSTLLKALEKTSLAKNSTSGQDSVQTISSYVPPWKRAQFSSKDIKQTGDKSEDSAIRKTKLEMIAEKLTPTETGEAHSKSEKRREDINSSDKVENEGSPFMLKSLPSHFGQPPSNNMSQGFARHALSDPSTSRSDLLRTIESQPAVDSITQEPRMVSSMLGATSSRAPVPQRFTSSVVPAPPMGAIPVRTPLQMKPALLQGVKMAKVSHYSNRPDEFGQLVGDCITTMSAEQRTHAINIIWDVLTEGNYHTLCEYSRLSGVMNGQESGKEGPSQPTNNPQPFINYGFPPSLPATKFPFPRSNDPTAYSFQGEKNPVTMSSDLTHKIQYPQPATHKTQESGPKQSLVGHNVASNQKSFPSVGNKCPPLLNQETLSKKAGLGVKTSQPKIKSKQKSPINPNPSSSKQGTNATKKTLAKNVVQKPQGAVKLSVKSQNESHPNPNEPTNWRDPARPFLSYVMNRSESTPKTENLATGSQNPVSTFEKVIPKTKANKDKSAIAGQPIPASEGSSKKKKKKIRVRNSAKTKPTSNS